MDSSSSPTQESSFPAPPTLARFTSITVPAPPIDLIPPCLITPNVARIAIHPDHSPPPSTRRPDIPLNTITTLNLPLITTEALLSQAKRGDVWPYVHQDIDFRLEHPRHNRDKAEAFCTSIDSLVAYIEYAQHLNSILSSSPELIEAGTVLCHHQKRQYDSKVQKLSLCVEEKDRRFGASKDGKRGLQLLEVVLGASTDVKRELQLLEVVLALVETWVQVLKEDGIMAGEWNPLNRITHPRFGWLLAARKEYEWKPVGKLQAATVLVFCDMVLVKQLKVWLVGFREQYTVWDVKRYGEQDPRVEEAGGAKTCWEKLREVEREAEEMFGKWERSLGYLLGPLTDNDIEKRIGGSLGNTRAQLTVEARIRDCWYWSALKDL
ncbi:hypothetical protein BJ508DRAFT_336414 [Ascobolus immersus RN42]|uniref:Uncharacterized protein n=1 Tax=Ascobolus immersus RN42 TaxID=1160509 RepID=A0A3N4H8N8_ASCIM|nr:hypothetical protein BJ508DRAFT_336414 [Ascobolus immersus RN42]